MGNFKLSKTSRERLVGIKPILIDIIETAIETSPIDFGIPADGGLRTAKRQQEMYRQGRTDMTKPRITNADGMMNKSRHQSGDAFDIYVFINGSASWNVEQLTVVANHLIAVAKTKGVFLEWGGNWKSFKDYPHFQIKTP